MRHLAARQPVGQEPRTDLVPGVVRCAKCAFQLHRTNLYLQSGTVGSGDSKTEPCPNGCGPLWPVTWETWAREGWAEAERLHLEMAALSAQPSPGGQDAAGLIQDLRAAVSLGRPLLHSDMDEIAAALAARPPVRVYGCCAQPEGELHTAECPNMRHLAARQPVAGLSWAEYWIERGQFDVAHDIDAFSRAEGWALQRFPGAHQSVGQEPAMYQVRPRSFPAGEGWREVSKRQFDDRGEFPGYPDTEWERRTLYAALPTQHSPTLTEIGIFLKKCDPRLVCDYVNDDVGLRTALWTSLALIPPAGDPVAWVNGRHLDECIAMPMIESNDDATVLKPRNIAASSRPDGYTDTPLYRHPAQAVDLGAVREAVRKAWQKCAAGKSVDLQFGTLLALIDSQAVGNG